MSLEAFGIKSEKRVEEKPLKKENTFFKTLYFPIDKKYKPTDEEMKKVGSFMLINVLSNNENTLQLATFLDMYRNSIPVEWQFKFADKVLPKMYIPYPKKKKEDMSDIELLQEHYCISQDRALEYLEMLPKEELDKIKRMYSEGKI